MKRILSALTILMLCGSAHAAVMARGKITFFDTTTSAPGTFAIKIEGPGGYVCNGSPQAISSSNFPDEESFKRTYAAALLAFVMGYTVELYSSPVSASCPYMAAMRVIQE